MLINCVCVCVRSYLHKTMTPVAYIAVHGGAGVHALKHEKQIKRALQK